MHQTLCPLQCCSGHLCLWCASTTLFENPAQTHSFAQHFKGFTVILSTDRIEKMSVDHVRFPHFLPLSLCDAAGSAPWSSPYKYSSWLMDPAAAVCYPVERGHIMYTRIQMCNNTCGVFVVVVKAFCRLLWVGGEQTLIQHSIFSLSCSALSFQNSCSTVCITITVSPVSSLTQIHCIHELRELWDYLG